MPHHSQCLHSGLFISSARYSSLAFLYVRHSSSPLSLEEVLPVLSQFPLRSLSCVFGFLLLISWASCLIFFNLQLRCDFPLYSFWPMHLYDGHAFCILFLFLYQPSSFYFSFAYGRFWDLGQRAVATHALPFES